MKHTMWTRTGLVWMLALAVPGCSKDKTKDTAEATATGDGTGSGSDGTTEPVDDRLVHDSEFALTVENAPVSITRTTQAVYAVEMTPESLSGFINYTEQDESGATTCSAVLTLRPEPIDTDPYGDTGAPAPEPPPPCESCTMWHYAHTDVSITSGDCAFGSVGTGLDQWTDLVNVPNTLLVHDKAGTSSFIVDILDSAGELIIAVEVTGSDTATFDGAALSGQNTVPATTFTHWRNCSSPTAGVTGILTPGDLSLGHTLACPTGVEPGTPVVSVWERDLAFTQQVTAGIQTTVDAVDLYLRTPDGCLAAVEPSPTSCINATSTLCMSLEHTVGVGGNHALLVVHRGCTTEGLDYSFDARVHQL